MDRPRGAPDRPILDVTQSAYDLQRDWSVPVQPRTETTIGDGTHVDEHRPLAQAPDHGGLRDRGDQAELGGHRDRGVTHVGSCGQGERVTILGRLRFVDLRPTDALATLVAELYDGTDAVQLVWLGRRSIPGVEPGRTLKARGRISYRDGHKVMYNPDYELMPVHA